MLTINAILKDLKDVPESRLEELFQFIQSLSKQSKLTAKSESLRKKILSFGGAFNDMSKKDYVEFVNQNKKVRSDLFSRNAGN